MSDFSKIEWTTNTFNPWWGCTRVSPGCANCYAERWSARFGRKLWGPGADRRITGKEYWKKPLKWAKRVEATGVREMVFGDSMCDIFDKEAPVEARRDYWKLVATTSQALDWQIVTKRPERIRLVMEEDNLENDFFFKNRVWLIVSTENQEWFNKRVPYILEIPALVRGISAEPLLGSIDTSRYINSLDWVIAGFESQYGARVCDPNHARTLRDQCVSADVAFFFKQNGEYLDATEARNLLGDDVPGRTVEAHNLVFIKVGTDKSGCLLDGEEWKQFPKVA